MPNAKHKSLLTSIPRVRPRDASHPNQRTTHFQVGFLEAFAAPDPLVSEFWGHSPSVAEREPNAWDPQRAAEQITSAEWEARCRVAAKGSKQQCRYKGVKEALGRLSAGSDETSGGGKAPQKNRGQPGQTLVWGSGRGSCIGFHDFGAQALPCLQRRQVTPPD